MLERIAHRTSNPYGKSDQERAEIAWNYQHIQPLLKQNAHIDIDSAAMSIGEIVELLIELALQLRALQ